MAIDRLNEIKNGSFTARDVMWLVSEVEQLRAERNSAINEASRLHSRLTGIHRSLSDAMSWSASGPDALGTLLTTVIHQRRGAMIELNEIHDILAKALDYQKAPTLEEDPNCPCPGAYVTGDHTAASLAVEAAEKLARRQTHTQALGRALDRTNPLIAELTKANRTAVDQIVKLQCELEGQRVMTGCLCRYHHNSKSFFAVPNCPLHGVAAEGKGAKKAKLRREIEALRVVCICPYNSEGDLARASNCPTHGNEARAKWDAGEKALNTLAYVRKYFMGSEHGHEM